jgi:D-methionine transport system substrate-binding protein
MMRRALRVMTVVATFTMSHGAAFAADSAPLKVGVRGGEDEQIYARAGHSARSQSDHAARRV